MRASPVAALRCRGLSRARANSTANTGRGMPICTSLRPILNGPSTPMTWSAASRNTAPPAMAWPVQAATTGTPNMYRRSNMRAPAATRARAASGPACITLRSKPAQNRPGRPAMSTALAPASSAPERASSRAAMAS